MRSAACGVGLALAAAAAGDFLRYRVPNSNIVVTLEGAGRKDGNSFTLRSRAWPQALRFDADRAELYAFESPRTKAIALVRKLSRDDRPVGDPDDLWHAGLDALEHGAPGEYFRAALALGNAAPPHAESAAARALAARWEAGIAESAEEVAAARAKAKGIPDGMKPQRSEHFLALHDLPNFRDKGKQATRAERRLALMERVYKSFLACFHVRGAELAMPRERMTVVFFKEQKDFHRYLRKTSPDAPESVAGFYSMAADLSCFYDNGSTAQHKSLVALCDRLQEQRMRKQQAGDEAAVEFIDMLQALKEISRESQDIEVISHEALHQVAASTGLMPRDRPVARWAAEGLATFFESPADCTWSGIGAVNERRLAGFKAFLRKFPDGFHPLLLAGDLPFAQAFTEESTEWAYAHAWSFTHFAMNERFAQLQAYYAELRKLPRFDVASATPREIALQEAPKRRAFEAVFPKSSWPKLSADWKAYHEALQTDFDRAVELGAPVKRAR